jgi:hypothetical protein
MFFGLLQRLHMFFGLPQRLHMLFGGVAFHAFAFPVCAAQENATFHRGCLVRAALARCRRAGLNLHQRRLGALGRR